MHCASLWKMNWQRSGESFVERGIICGCQKLTLLITILLGMIGYFMCFRSTPFNLPRAAIRSAHSVVYSKALRALSTWDIYLMVIWILCCEWFNIKINWTFYSRPVLCITKKFILFKNNGRSTHFLIFPASEASNCITWQIFKKLEIQVFL